MATLITVHGTNDTGPENGDKWWQRGGPLEDDIRRWVTSDDGSVNFVPHIWHARNSEAGRFEAAQALARHVRELEAAGEKYCFVSHSHGGSVIAHMLGLMQQQQDELPNLTRWVTVATPFIHMQRRNLLFARLTTPGVAALMIVLFLFLMWAAFAASAFYLMFITKEGLKNPHFDIMVLVLAPLFMTALYLALRVFQPAKLRMLSGRSREKRREMFGARWLGLWHSDDEVINAGRVLKNIAFKPFRSDFASPLFAFVSLLLIPVVLWAVSYADFYTLLSAHIRNWDPSFGAATEPDGFKAFARNSLAIVCLPAIALFELLAMLGMTRSADPNMNLAMIGGTLLLGAAIGFYSIWVLAMLMHRLVLLSSRVISAALSAMLNDLTQKQVVALGYGDDAPGERATGSRPYPLWIPDGAPSLPAALEADITNASDEAATDTIVRLRQSMSELDFGGAGEAGDILSRHVTWSELVHTNYFRVPRLRKLIAYIVAQQDGFRPTEEFAADPEYALMGEWLRQIEQKRPAS